MGNGQWAFEALPGLHVNGAQTLGENIGALSGLTVALDACHDSLGGKPAPFLDGFNGDQRFFVGWAHVWRMVVRDAFIRRIVATNPHTPASSASRASSATWTPGTKRSA
ncbi:MAG TPA: M13-type metalloendopeptidase [Vicinamibacterales bacterium]|nr:M13-type metalloendopeptidase [Vicinamibacterales bacterium]